MEEEESPTRFVNCGLKEVDPTRYRRDYYVKDGPDASKRKSWGPSSGTMSKRPPSVEVPVNRMKSNDDEEPIIPVRIRALRVILII